METAPPLIYRPTPTPHIFRTYSERLLTYEDLDLSQNHRGSPEEQIMSISHKAKCKVSSPPFFSVPFAVLLFHFQIYSVTNSLGLMTLYCFKVKYGLVFFTIINSLQFLLFCAFRYFPCTGNIFTNEQITSFIIHNQKLNSRTLRMFDVPQTNYALYN